jgi:hypothetical protein
MTKLRCVVERITYQNAENGYSVMKVKVKGYDDLVTLWATCWKCGRVGVAMRRRMEGG